MPNVTFQQVQQKTDNGVSTTALERARAFGLSITPSKVSYAKQATEVLQSLTNQQFRDIREATKVHVMYACVSGITKASVNPDVIAKDSAFKFDSNNLSVATSTILITFDGVRHPSHGGAGIKVDNIAPQTWTYMFDANTGNLIGAFD